ncbi:biotin--[acetyl-CoA-carboxylase] ligase [Candidatus Nitrosopelagicus brevis]|uniref:Biotin-(Acetyl-CoA-carboxylase) ligase n=1 Tax=Candidatus Nitrosopelagicus brevis TaxID=1410606 RepID=A0A0A7UYQ4_9ARCH|nr:biotin--[acetyl-CoA-carboxylase] ligase [Candidatus Nitrosopelagicus brevis]AJA91944.1 biotin-(acetyl-CoA-carboxylase) ligase [Candidatus Nitrosopelagicus brevis]PTL87845.1 biotin--[acetyl-CoA-carboxylase] ligase [Candidatus Nitrosopelagicus brevis]
MSYTSFDNVGLVKVLSFFQTHDSEYLSGQDLSDVLKISRVAVWKHIKKIQTLGYKIESKQKLGYRLIDNTEKLLPWEITRDLKTKLIGKRVYYFEEIDSTQNFAQNIAADKKENGTIIIAEKQTSGRGRLDRKWTSPKGGIWFSLIIHPKFDVSSSTLIPILSAVALSKSIKSVLDIETEVKWPNDITMNGKKVAGVLVDASFQTNSIDYLILGIGINFDIDAKKLEKRLTKTPNFYGIDSLRGKENKTPPKTLLKEFLLQFEKNLFQLDKGEKSTIVKEWTKRAAGIGKKITINTSNGKISGISQGIDNDGALKIKTKNETKKIYVGDVVLS